MGKLKDGDGELVLGGESRRKEKSTLGWNTAVLEKGPNVLFQEKYTPLMQLPGRKIAEGRLVRHRQRTRRNNRFIQVCRRKDEQRLL